MEKGHMIAFAPVSGGVRKVIDDVQTDEDQFMDLYSFYRGRHGRLCGMYIVPEEDGPELRMILSPSRGNLVNLRLPVHDSYPSLSRRFPEASWFERALAERERIIPLGHPDLRPIRLRHADGGWMEPLEGGREEYFHPCQQDGHIQVPVGPVHAGIIGSGHFRFHVQGEPIEAMQVLLGYCHRGLEGMLQRARSNQSMRLVERISGDNGVAHSLAYCQALEGGIEPTLCARCIRTVLAELERVHNHLGDIGGIALDVAFMLPAQRLFALKEDVLRINLNLTGHRYGWNSIRPGGVLIDLDSQKKTVLERSLIAMGLELESIVKVLNETSSFVDRVETTGKVAKDVAEQLMLVGPSARASGVIYDVRENLPYAAYGEVGMRIPFLYDGDVLARMDVRIEEIRESISIIMQALEMMPEEETLTPLPSSDHHDGIGIVESPRGELVHAVHIRDGKVVRHMVKDPSFHNWKALEYAVLGNIIPDFPVINKSFNLSYSGNDI